MFTQRHIVLHVHSSDLIVILRNVQYYIQKTNETIVHKSKSIVLYILDNVVIKYTLKEPQTKASAECILYMNWMRTVDEHRSETVKISSEALEEVNVYL